MSHNTTDVTRRHIEQKLNHLRFSCGTMSALPFYSLAKGNEAITLASVWGVGTPRMKVGTSKTCTPNNVRPA